jgi:gliding motility-associated transport system ATP-binding protein
MIEVKNLTKMYGNFVAVKNVTFQAKKGQILGFLGPNGAGKTTTMRIISGYMPATTGTVLVDGLDIFSQSLEARRRIGYLPENPPLYNEMRVEAYLRFAGKLRGLSRGDLDTALEHVLEVCGLREVSTRICGQLSKGYRQRVGLAGAIIHEPQVLILDEPTIGLDPRQIRDVRALIRNLGTDRTIVLSTHILPEVSQICDKVVIINEGHVVLEQNLDQMVAGTSLEDVFLTAIAHERGHEDVEAEEELEEVGAGRSSAQ